jgi:hypothetical protein
MSPAELEELQKQLAAYLEKGWIRPSTSAFGAPVVFAKKADGTLRFCVDYRALNNITIKNAYPLPRIDELLDHLEGAKFFTSLDLSQAYHQIPMHPSDVHKTAFRTRYGHYEFLVMPFGLTNAPATCQAVMNDVLRPYLDKFTSIYLDDCLIWSRTEAEHLEHIRLVLEAMAKANLRLKASKCAFGKLSTKFLGYIISADGLAMDPGKVTAITNWPEPTTLTELRSFLGFCNFYRRFVSNYSTIAAPLTSLTSALSPFPIPLSQEARDAFLQLKAAMCSAPVLTIPHTGPDATFSLYTDASRVGIGAVLEQNGRPVAYESRKLSPAERNYPVHELELLAVVHALREFRPYLEGCKHFTLLTDHQSLRYFFKQKDLSRRQVGWMDTLMDFQSNMDIQYLPGEKNRADALSRHLADAHVCTMFEVSCPDLLPAIKAAYAHDPLYAERQSSDRALPNMTLGADGLYRWQGRVCVPKDDALRTRLLAEFHDAPSAGHPGAFRTLTALAEHYWWPRMSRQVAQYVRSCTVCQRIKPSTQAAPGLLYPLPTPTRPWTHVSLDLITDLPPSCAHDGKIYDSILTFVDMLTKQAFFIRTNKTITSTDLAHLYLDHVYRLKGLSLVLVSDRDPRMTAEFWQTLFRRLGTGLNMSTAAHPQTDGQTERTHRTIEQVLRAYVDPMHDDWATWLPLAEFAYNSAQHASTGLSPFEANYGFRPHTPVTVASCGASQSRLDIWPSSSDLAANPDQVAARLRDLHRFVAAQVAAAKDRYARLANAGRRDLHFNVGDMVMLSTRDLSFQDQPCRKFRDCWLGPFPVEAVVSPVAYRLALPLDMRTHPVFHASKLKPAVLNPPAFAARPRPSRRPGPRLMPDNSVEYNVHSITAVGLADDHSAILFRVHWTGYDSEDDTWQTGDTLCHLPAYRRFVATKVYRDFMARVGSLLPPGAQPPPPMTQTDAEHRAALSPQGSPTPRGRRFSRGG